MFRFGISLCIANETRIAEYTLKKWFGDGKRMKPEYKEVFEKYIDKTTKKAFLRQF